jgi:hypothetical protein
MTIRSLLEHVGIDTRGEDIWVGDRLVDPWWPGRIGRLRARLRRWLRA